MGTPEMMTSLNPVRVWISGFITDNMWGDLAFMGLMLAAGFVLAMIVKGIVKLIERFVTTATETDLDDKILSLINQSIAQVIYIVAFYYSFDEIREHFSEIWQKIIIGLAVTTFVFLICRFLSKLFDIIMQWYIETIASKTETSIDDELAPLVERLVKIVIYVTGVAVVLNYFHVDLTGLAIGGAAVSFAVGYASQDTLSNMISGFVIMIDRPFRVGDRVKLVTSQLTGDVIRIGLRSTKILNFDNHVVIIPNSEIAKSQLINLSYPDPASRIKMDIPVAYGTDLELAKKLLVEIATGHAEVLKDPEPKAFFIEFKDSELLVTLVCRVAHYKDEFRVAEDLRLAIDRVFRDNRIEIPLPQQVVYLRGDLQDSKTPSRS
ncbi:MAG: mechanosensitive ion channel [Bacteroidetes bacterium]|nr:mechanosensitive ion channel [Bacteroidota bacterium]